MDKSNMFIGDKEFLNILLKSLNLICDEEERKHFVSKLYPHIEHTRRTSYKNGYDQGKFDENIERLNGIPEHVKEYQKDNKTYKSDVKSDIKSWF